MRRAKKVDVSSLGTSELGYLIGLFIGDGSICTDRKSRHYKVAFSLNPWKDSDTQNFLIKLLREMTLNPFTVWANGCIDIRVNSKNFTTFLRKREKVSDFDLRDREFFIGFLSGLIDSDGYVEKGDIVVSMKNPEILRKVQKAAERFHIRSRLRKQIQTKPGGSEIWRLHVTTNFKRTNHLSRKIKRIYR